MTGILNSLALGGWVEEGGDFMTEEEAAFEEWFNSYTPTDNDDNTDDEQKAVWESFGFKPVETNMLPF